MNTADGNTATGAGALLSNTTGNSNIANGAFALLSNTQGNDDTAVGNSALRSNTTGIRNTATGSAALRGNVTGNANTGIGYAALASNTGDGNTATGSQALQSNTTGHDNTANGDQALFNNTGGVPDLGSFNIAVGTQALLSNTIGAYNTAIGYQALSSNVEGNLNTAVGWHALLSSNGGAAEHNTAVGAGAGFSLTGASNVTCLGFGAGSLHATGDNDLYLGNPGVDGENSTVRLGTGNGVHQRMFVAGVRGVTTGQPNAIPVLIDGDAQLGTQSSSQRYKKDIKQMDSASEVILALNPVTFHYKSDNTATPQFGLIAEEVADINPDLVVRDENGEIYTVRYDAVNAMLLNEFLKEHRTVQGLRSVVAKQEANAVRQQKQIDALTAGLQRVSAQLELNKHAPQTVLNND